MKHVLIVTLPRSEPQQFELKGKRIGLGREVDNEIRLDVPEVSSSHLEFRKTDKGYEMEDLNSRNGTRVNGKVMQVTTLADGDRLLIAETVPAHYLMLAEGETWEAGIDKGSDEDRKVAGEYSSMSDRLEKLEENIEAKEKEAARLESQLSELRANYQKQLSEYGEAQLALEKLQAEMDEKRQRGNVSAEEMKKLENDLIQKTQKVKVMSAKLVTKQKQISRLEGAAVAPPLVPKGAPAPKIPIKKPAAQVAKKKTAAQGAKTMPLSKGQPAPPPRLIVKKKEDT